MFKNYLITGWRNLKKRKFFSFIHIIGLATGMAACLLVGFYIRSETGFDRFHERGEHIYRLALERIYPGRISLLGEIPQSIGQAARREFPEILESTRIVRVGQSLKANDQSFSAEQILGVDSNFLRVFSASLIRGSRSSILHRPNTAILTESAARRIFGSASTAMGKHILLNGIIDCLIDGVCRDWPQKSHFRFSVLVAGSSFHLYDQNFYDLSTYTYLLLDQNASVPVLEKKLPQIVKKYVAPTIPKGFGESFEQFTKDGNGYRYFLQALSDIHLNSRLEDELSPTIDIRFLYLAATIGLFILTLACINFVNLSTAISAERAREVGVRKTFGSDKRSIIFQFLSESLLYSFFSICVSLILATLFVPFMNTVTGSHLVTQGFFSAGAIFSYVIFALLVGLIAGIYPAFVLSSFQPIKMLKGRFKTGVTGIALRNGLVFFQFTVTGLLIVATLVVHHQIAFMLSENGGFSKANVITIRDSYRLGNARTAFVNDLTKIPGVIQVSLCSDLPQGQVYASSAMMSLDSRAQRTDRTASVDEQYANTLGLQIVAGRFFSRAFGSDSTALILNEAAVEDFGLKSPLGSRITSTELRFNPEDGKSQTVYTVVGVIKNYHFESMHQRIAPLILVNAGKFGASTIAVLIDRKAVRSAISSIENLWNRADARDNFQLSFLDDVLAEQYKSELASQQILTAFALLAVLIACIGVLGLVMFSTFARAKEISVRKVLGANAGDIIYILSKGYLKLMILATLCSFPISYWAMHRWLEQFAYRIEINAWVFLIATAIITCIVLLTIPFQAVRAALANPVKAMRME